MSHCCLCGLLCSLDRAATQTCPRRSQWLHQLSELAVLPSSKTGSREPSAAAHQQSSASPQWTTQVEAIAAHFQPGQRTLIWIDAADVHTLRCAVRLAAAVRGTVHVAHSTGAAVAHRVLTSQGWLGTTLAEVASHADLIVSLGSGLRTEAPLLAQRFFSPALASGRGEWCHIDSQAATSSTATSLTATSADQSDALSTWASDELSPNWTGHWPRSEWYAQLTQLMLGLQGEHERAEPAADRLFKSTGELLGKLRSAKYCVWLWDVDEFRDEMDELCIQRLLGISRLLSQTARCSLLALDAQVGRVTAAEALLWLTGCHGTARFDGQHWHQPDELADMRLEDWPSAFDSIVAVRSLPSVYALPSLQASHFIVPQLSLLPDHVADHMITHVGSVGVHSAGHVMRGDRGSLLFCEAAEPAREFAAAKSATEREVSSTTQSSTQSAATSSATSLRRHPQLPTAAELLEQVLQRVQVGGECHAN